MKLFLCGLILGLAFATSVSVSAWREDDQREWQRDADFWQLRSMEQLRRMERRNLDGDTRRGNLGQDPCE